MLKVFTYQSGKWTSKGTPNSPEKQPFKQLILKCGILKLTFLYTSEAKKLEPEIQKHDTHDHKHIVGITLLKSRMWSKQCKCIRVQNSMGKHGLETTCSYLLESSWINCRTIRRINCNNDCTNLKIHQRKWCFMWVNWLLRFNVEFMTQIYADQPSSSIICGTFEYRPLEGFVYAITPLTLLRCCQSSCKRCDG
jgi:1-pyrroline-5-carboxylate dehydrogenase